MSNSEVDLASLLCSKICHDLLSPVGAINNGLELLEDETDPVMRDRCMDLLADSARVSADKLKYFRLAFGAAGGFGDNVDPAEARGLIESLIGDSGKITLGWALQGEALPKKAIKILLNLALIAKESLVRGGTLDVGAEQGELGIEVVVRAEGIKIALDSGIRTALDACHEKWRGSEDFATIGDRIAFGCYRHRLRSQGEVFHGTDMDAVSQF